MPGRACPCFNAHVLLGVLLGVATLAAVGGAARPVCAEDLMPKPTEALDYLAPSLMADARPRWQAAAPDAGAAWGGFLVWPTAGAAALVDSNPLQRHRPHGVEPGLRLTPRVVAERESGVHATVLYGLADAALYPARPDADQLDGRIGVLHDWAPRRDMIVRLQADLAEARDALDSRAATTGTDGGRPFMERTATLAGSAQKTFDRLFVSLGGDAVQTHFSDGGLRTVSGARAVSDQSGTDIRGRVGYVIGPALYAYAEPAANWRVLDAVDDRTSGTRLVAGLGTDRMALGGGEVYAGLQRQDYTRAPRRVSEPVFGGRLAWWPTPAWTVALAADRRLEQAAVGTAAEPLGTPVDVMTETASLRFTPSPVLWAELALDHAAVRYLGTGREDDLLGADGRLAFGWRHDLDLTADLRLTRVRSTAALASYDRAAASLGALYRY